MNIRPGIPTAPLVLAVAVFVTALFPAPVRAQASQAGDAETNEWLSLFDGESLVGWPSNGFEIQVNNSYEHDHRRTGSLYGLDNVTEPPAGDNRWFSLYFKVEGRQVTVLIDGCTVVKHRVRPPSERQGDGRRLSSGTFALQGHDPGSRVYYRNIEVRPLYP